MAKKLKKDKTTSFPCPACEKDGKRSWTQKRKLDGFFCPICGNTYSSYESVKILLDELEKDKNRT